MANPEEAIIVTSGDSDEGPSASVENTIAQSVETPPPQPEPTSSEPQFVEPRHSYYENDASITLDVFDKGVDPANVNITFQPRSIVYQNGVYSRLQLSPLKGEIDPDKCSFTVLRVKVEIRITKRVQMRWGALIGDSPDILAAPTPFPQPIATEPTGPPKPRKNWDSISTSILKKEQEQEKTHKDDPNAGGDIAANKFFQDLFANADPDTKRAMMKSYQESNGTTLSTNWDEVSKGFVKGKAPEGSVMKKWNR